MGRCNLNPWTYEKLFALLLHWKCRACLNFLMERIIYSPTNLNFYIWPEIENHTSKNLSWKISKGQDHKTQDVIKANITDMQLRGRLNEIVVLSFLSNFCPYFVLLKHLKKPLKDWSWYVGRNREKSARTLQTFEPSNLSEETTQSYYWSFFVPYVIKLLRGNIAVATSLNAKEKSSLNKNSYYKVISTSSFTVKQTFNAAVFQQEALICFIHIPQIM